ncbi:hypothetical protein FB451DRAFT_1184757 [Mycena latifolia]|nr:hypothetical protein FB451DRAFT_1184757 [Mycena latifolia]
MLFTPTRFLHLVALALSLSSALAWQMMVYEPTAGGTAQCTGGGTTISGGDNDGGVCNQLVPGNVAALKVLGSAAGATCMPICQPSLVIAYDRPDCLLTGIVFTQNSGCVATNARACPTIFGYILLTTEHIPESFKLVP